LSSSSVAPLQFENSRLRAELESTNGHRKWLENELHSRSKEISEMKSKFSETDHNLRRLLNEAKTANDEYSAEIAAQKMQNESLQRRLDLSQREILEREENHANSLHEVRLELQAERRLVALNKENVARLEERYNDAVREIETARSLAAEAKQDHLRQIESLQVEWENDFNKRLLESNEDYEEKIEEYKRLLDSASVEKAQLEDQLMSIGGVRVPQIEWKSDSDEPMTLTKLYEKLSEAEDIIRKERGERKKLEMYLERVQKDVETFVPRQMQERKEYEFAMTQAHEIQIRLNDALEERQRAITELQRVEKELSDTTREYDICHRESNDLAHQVQKLLQRSLEDGDLASEMADQNRRLIQEHHRMSVEIDELKTKLDNDSTQQKLMEFEAMKDEMRNQAVLVSNIIQQRDLYRALLSKHDSKLLADASGGGAIVATKDQLERFSEFENEKKDLADTISKLNAEVASLVNVKIGLEERLARTDSYANGLSTSLSKIQAELSAAHSATARSNAEASFHIQRVERLEESLQATKKELMHLTTEKQRFIDLNDNLQQKLSQSRDLEAKLQEDLRQAQVQIRFVETKAASLAETESRLIADNNSLRSELSRHMALQESIQKLESQLSVRSVEDHDRLEEEVNKLTSLLQSERSKFTFEKEKLENLLADAELRTKDAEKSKLDALAANLKAKEDLAMAESDKNLLRDKFESLERSLAAAKATHGDSETGNDDKEVIQSLKLEIQTLKEDLQAATKKVEDFKKLAKESESTLVDSTNANRIFKEATSSEIEKLRNDLKAANETAIAKQKAFEALSNDLNSKKSGHDKTLEELKAKVESLETKLKSSVADQEAYKKQNEEVKSEILIYKADIRAANDNYERELALHAEARRELQKTREALESESRLRRDVELALESTKNEFERERSALAEVNQQTLDIETEDRKRLNELNEQNKILHNQIALLNEVIERIQSEKLAAVSGELTDIDKAISAEDATILTKQVAELREVLRYVRNEKDIVEAQLQSARRNAEAERAAAEIAKRSLEELRIEIDVLTKSKRDSNSTVDDIAVIESKLKQAEDQVDVLKESNRLLREETSRLQEFISKTKTENTDMVNKLQSAEQRCLVLETDKSALEAEKTSLNKELGDWKDRVKSLVTQFHQIDPEEHEKALKQLEESKNEISKLQIEHANVERECASAKGLVMKLNKKIQDMKSQLDLSKAEVIKANAEKDLLIKSSESSATAEKEAQELQKKLESAMAEKDILEKRMEHLKIILRTNKSKSNETQQKLQEALQAEKEARSKVQQEKESFEARLKEIDSSSSTTKITSEENQVVNQLDSAQVDNVEVPDESTTKKSSKAISSEVEATIIPPARIPTVPKEGFKFIASKVSGENADNTITSVNENDALTEQTSSEMNMQLAETEKNNSTSEVSEKSSSNILTTVPTKKVDTTENVTKANSSQTSKETSLKEKLLEKKRKMAESIAAQKLALQSSVANAPKTDTQQDSKDSVMDTKKESNVDPKAPVPAPSNDTNATTSDVVDDKNHTESDRDNNRDLRSAEEEENADKVEEEENSGKVEEETKEESKEENDQEPPNKPSKTVLGSSLNPAAAPFKLFGSGSSAPVFGQGTSAPLLGSSSTGTMSATRGGTFLNLKPPGSGPAAPLTFGSSPNITIPTPSKDPLPVESQPFAAFKGGPFPFGARTTSQPQATSLFDASSNIGKKRSLETDDTQEAENASTKLARVEEEKSEEKDEEDKVEEINETHEESIEEADEDDLEE
jgi:nucleoprotein TPR